jgi:flagellar biosynthesis regulator FlbT
MALTRENLLTLEAYAKARSAMRAEVIEHKKRRTVHLGNHVTLLFEDEVTVRYQVQEMLRIEKLFEDEEIQSELDAYNPLVPDGSNFKATMLIEYGNEVERKAALAKLIGIEDRLFIEVEGQGRVYAIADEDLDRENDEKTSAVHFVRFELTSVMKGALKSGAQMMIGCDHPNYPAHVEDLPQETLAALLKDLD